MDVTLYTLDDLAKLTNTTKDAVRGKLKRAGLIKAQDGKIGMKSAWYLTTVSQVLDLPQVALDEVQPTEEGGDEEMIDDEQLQAEDDYSDYDDVLPQVDESADDYDGIPPVDEPDFDNKLPQVDESADYDDESNYDEQQDEQLQAEDDYDESSSVDDEASSIIENYDDEESSEDPDALLFNNVPTVDDSPEDNLEMFDDEANVSEETLIDNEEYQQAEYNAEPDTLQEEQAYSTESVNDVESQLLYTKFNHIFMASNMYKTIVKPFIDVNGIGDVEKKFMAVILTAIMSKVETVEDLNSTMDVFYQSLNTIEGIVTKVLAPESAESTVEPDDADDDVESTEPTESDVNEDSGDFSENSEDKDFELESQGGVYNSSLRSVASMSDLHDNSDDYSLLSKRPKLDPNRLYQLANDVQAVNDSELADEHDKVIEQHDSFHRSLLNVFNK